jgi:hypothetical protein
VRMGRRDSSEPHEHRTNDGDPLHAVLLIPPRDPQSTLARN